MECTCFEVAIYEDEYGIHHENYCPEYPADTRRPKKNVVDGTPCNPEFLADMVVNRWMLHTPNLRENIRMRIDKFTSSKNSRNNWMKTGANFLKPLYGYFKAKMLKVKSILKFDETWSIFLYDNDENDSRGSRPITEFLRDFKGSSQSDSYVVYKHLSRIEPENVHLLCWAHVRTKLCILSGLHDRTSKMKKNKRLHYGDLMNRALNYT